MAFSDVVHRASSKLHRSVTGRPYASPIARFTGRPCDIQPRGELGRIFAANTGRIVHKWLHYLPIYERHLATRRGTEFRMLEIGVYKGGSLQMWREYFGARAIICGVDIDPDCAAYADAPNRVMIGSQDDAAFLDVVVGSMGGVDVVLDDGSHIGRHQIASFNALWPRLPAGGLYIIEDTHTAYWPGHCEGGYRRPGTAVEFVKTLIDDMHHWYHGRGGRDDVGAVHVYDSIVVIEKRTPTRPMHVKTGVDPA